MRYSDALEIEEFRVLKEKHAAARTEYEGLCNQRNLLNLRIEQADKYEEELYEAVLLWLDSH